MEEGRFYSIKGEKVVAHDVKLMVDKTIVFEPNHSKVLPIGLKFKDAANNRLETDIRLTEVDQYYVATRKFSILFMNNAKGEVYVKMRNLTDETIRLLPEHDISQIVGCLGNNNGVKVEAYPSTNESSTTIWYEPMKNVVHVRGRRDTIIALHFCSNKHRMAPFTIKPGTEGLLSTGFILRSKVTTVLYKNNSACFEDRFGVVGAVIEREQKIGEEIKILIHNTSDKTLTIFYDDILLRDLITQGGVNKT